MSTSLSTWGQFGCLKEEYLSRNLILEVLAAVLQWELNKLQKYTQKWHNLAKFGIFLKIDQF